MAFSCPPLRVSTCCRISISTMPDSRSVAAGRFVQANVTEPPPLKVNRLPGRKTRHHGPMRRVVILGRGAAGKCTLARHLGDLTGLPVIELDTMFWQPGLTPAELAGRAARQRELCSRDTWIIDGARMPRA